MKIYIIAKSEVTSRGHGESYYGLVLPVNNGRFPPAFNSKEEAETWGKAHMRDIGIYSDDALRVLEFELFSH